MLYRTEYKQNMPNLYFFKLDFTVLFVYYSYKTKLKIKLIAVHKINLRNFVLLEGLGMLMKILVCFKVVPAIDLLTQEEWYQVVREGMDFGVCKKELGCFDEAALEFGLRLGDLLKMDERSVSLTAVTVGHQDSDALIRNLFAVGYKHICRLQTDADLTYSPLATATLLADFVRQSGGYDLILLGQQAGGGDSGQVHWLLSELLGVPCQTQKECVALPKSMPVIWAVENAECPYLRIATLREKMAAGKLTVETIEVTPSVPIYKPKNIWRDDKQRHCRMLEGETTAERVAALYTQVLQEVLKQ